MFGELLFWFLLLVVTVINCVVGLYIFSRRGRAGGVQTPAGRQIPWSGSTGAGDGLDFSGKVAIITGGGTGLGKAMALSLARRGAKVVVVSRKMEHLAPVVEEIRAAGGQALAIPLDVRQNDQVEAAVAQTLKEFGRIDILVNNAAGNFATAAEDLSVNGWNAVVGIVLNGTFYCTRAAGKEMLKQGSGTILNIVANYAWSGAPGMVHSCSAKAGVLAMTRTLAVEFGRKGVRVNAFAPGTMVTDGASVRLKFADPSAQEKIRSAVPLQRLTSAEEMAELAVFLCSERAAYVNGECFTADGGAWLPRGLLALQE